MVDSWRDSAKEQTEKRVQQNREDLNNEMAGRDTSRIKRFTSPNHEKNKDPNDQDSDYLLNIISQILTEEQRRHFKRLQHQFDLNNKAIALALADIEEELIQAQQDLQLIQDNATTLVDGRRIYIDEDSGHFYDENDQRISENEEITALDNYHKDDTTRQDINSAIESIENLEEEREELIEYSEQQEELQARLDANPQEAAEIEEELNSLSILNRMYQHQVKLTTNIPLDEKIDNTTSAVKEFSIDEGIIAELELLPAFHHAGGFEQDSNDPVQNPDYNKSVPQPFEPPTR